MSAVTATMVQHPDGRWGVMVPFEMFYASGNLSTHAHEPMPTGYPRKRVDPWLLAIFDANEFDPERPCEAIRLDAHGGVGFFYLALATDEGRRG